MRDYFLLLRDGNRRLIKADAFSKAEGFIVFWDLRSWWGKRKVAIFAADTVAAVEMEPEV